MANSPIATKVNKEKFLEAFGQCGTLKHAAESAGVSTRTATRWFQDPAFAAALEDARRLFVNILEAEIHRRAVEGVEKPVYFQGKEVGRIREYSDNLLMFLVKRHDPAYRDRMPLELVGAGGGPVTVQFIPPPGMGGIGRPRLVSVDHNGAVALPAGGKPRKGGDPG